MKLYLLGIYTLWLREIVRFYRQKSRVIGAVVPPLIFWLLIGSGMGGTLQFLNVSDFNYLQYLFPGIVMMIILFSSIFSTISIIEDRKEGFLQSVIVAPIPRSSIALGKILGGASISFFQGFAFVLLALFFLPNPQAFNFLWILPILALSSIGLTGLGFLIAWQMDSAQGFHSIMNLFLMPMWFLSGALFSIEGAPPWLRWAMTLNPLTYGVTALHYGFYSPTLLTVHFFPSPTRCFSVTLLFALIMVALSIFSCTRYPKK